MSAIKNKLIVLLLISYSTFSVSQNNIKKDTIYISYNPLSDRIDKNYVKLSKNEILVSINYKIRDSIYWKNLKLSKKNNALIGDNHHGHFSLNYILKYGKSTSNYKEFPNEFTLKKRKEFNKIKVLDWDNANSVEEKNHIINNLKNAKTIFLIENEKSNLLLFRLVKYKP
ncbi:hypothetical protein GCM10022271_26150 [Corallibacter vietnamensis]|uniref:DUF3868 domain-containing protein n=1 Tax=Corallibacter vietnamensis TaxID=904130 RepID=A0ABP7HMN0_9FLAO